MEFYFLLISLFFPRLTIVATYLFFRESYPTNTVPFLLDLLLAIAAPRVLILIYIYQNMGYENIWFVAHLLAAILAYVGGGGWQAKRRRRNRD